MTEFILSWFGSTSSWEEAGIFQEIDRCGIGFCISVSDETASQQDAKGTCDDTILEPTILSLLADVGLKIY
jgi:hypothetical protein